MTDELEGAANLFVAVLQGARMLLARGAEPQLATRSEPRRFVELPEHVLGRRMLGFDAVAERRHGRLGARGAFA